MNNVTIRPMSSEDKAFVTLSWNRSYRPYVRWLPKTVYYRWYGQAIGAWLDHQPAESVLVASPAGGPEMQILGWLASDSKTKSVHYIFVKSHYRNLGLARALLREAFADKNINNYTHYTSDFEKYIINRVFGLNPNIHYRADLWIPPRAEK